jgi:hypothetical protein
MATWGATAFDNDVAAAWAAALVAGGTAESVLETLGAVAGTPDEEYLDATDASEALAAAEVVAAAGGRPLEEDVSEDTVDWAAGHPELRAPQWVELAREAVQRVLGGESELRDQWLDEGATDWTAAMDNLQYRLALV